MAKSATVRINVRIRLAVLASQVDTAGSFRGPVLQIGAGNRPGLSTGLPSSPGRGDLEGNPWSSCGLGDGS